jgi:hypothetical protein
MRIQLSAFSLLCLLNWAGACTDDPAETGPLDSSTGGAAPGAGTGGMGMPAGPAPSADGGAARDAGASDASSATADAQPPGQGEAGAEAGTPAQSDAGPQGQCPSKYTTAVRLGFEVSWPDTVGYLGGKALVRGWSKLTFIPTAGGAMVESVPCGVALPVISGSLLVGGTLFFNEIPVSAFEQRSMPRFTGRATRQGGNVVIDPGTVVLGTTLSDPDAAWPYRASLVAADHDGDGKPGVTAIARQDPPYGLPPADIGFTQYLDAVYVASRMKLQLKAASEGCGGPVEGDVEPSLFNYTVVGCHVQDGGECEERSVSLVENQNPSFTLGSKGQWKSVPIAEGATCSEVVKAVPAE